MTTRPPAPLTHHLQGRSDDELTWFQRRSVVQAAALWVAGGGWVANAAGGYYQPPVPTARGAFRSK